MLRALKLVKPPKNEGIDPLRLLTLRSKEASLVKFRISQGMEPLNLLKLRNKVTKLIK